MKKIFIFQNDFFSNFAKIFLASIFAVYFYSLNIGLNPKYSTLLTCLGSEYRKKGHLEKALAATHQAVKYNPLNGEAYYQMGRVYEDKGPKFIALAIENYRTAIALDSSLADASFRLAMIYFDQKDYIGAIRYLKQKVSKSMLKPQYTYFYYYLGECYSQEKHYPEAFSNYFDFLKIGGDPSEGLPKLKLIYQLLSDKDKVKKNLAKMRTFHNLRDAAILEEVIKSSQ